MVVLGRPHQRTGKRKKFRKNLQSTTFRKLYYSVHFQNYQFSVHYLDDYRKKITCHCFKYYREFSILFPCCIYTVTCKLFSIFQLNYIFAIMTLTCVLKFLQQKEINESRWKLGYSLLYFSCLPSKQKSHAVSCHALI